jgi:very-short-patch-repair endonuclease
LKKRAESDFEIEVGERIIRRGYKVIPQFKPLPNDFNYRVDLVVQGEKSRVGVECDGDRYHGPEKWENDQRRETQLRRAGWKFWRISGSAFYREKERSLEGLWRFLEDERIRPYRLSDEAEGGEKSNLLGKESGEQKLTGSSLQNESMNKERGSNEEDKSSRTTLRTGENINDSMPDGISIQSRDRIGEMKELIDLISNWKAWQELIDWGHKTGNVDSHSRAISWQVLDNLKLGRKMPLWLRNEMIKIWKTANKKGFKPKI